MKFFTRTLLMALAAATALTPTSAQAASYDYWGYFHASGTGAPWEMSMEGATYVPQDGTVEGWRFVRTTGDEMPAQPRVAPDFSSLCGSTPVVEGQKRVGLVVDFGTVDPADAQETLATCVQVPESADGFAVLQAATTITTTDGMVTCVQGVPSASCEAVAVTTAAEDGSSTNSGGLNSTHILLAVIATLLAAVVIGRRRTR